MTIRDALLQGARRLEQSRVPNSRLNAESLLAHALGVDRLYLYIHDDRALDDGEAQRFETTVAARVSGVPTQYIVGRQEFFGRNFTVNPSVLIPRPETELIIETVLELAPAGSAPRILDIGTGSGAITVTLALERPSAQVFATDLSFDALQVAKQNASALGARVSFALMDLGSAIGTAGAFDFVVSNPPYVNPEDAATLEREVRDHEPSLALFAPDQGFEVIRRLIPESARLIQPGGYLIFEIGMGMADGVIAQFSDSWSAPYVRSDLQGIPRVVVARRVR
jgi:release factor glutamine methyltransferase